MVRRLLLLNGVAIVNVILFHATGFGFTAMFAWAHRYRLVAGPNYDDVGTTAYYMLRLIEQFVAFTIPAFLFVSGFFVSVLAGRTRARVGASEVAARIGHLLGPYLFWTGVVLIGFSLQGRVFSGARYFRMVATGSSNPNYYYVPLLIQLYLVAPLLVILARWRWQALLLATAAVQITVYVLQYPIVIGFDSPVVSVVAASLPKWFFAVYLFWFTAGVVAGFQQQQLKVLVARTRWVWLAAAVTLFVIGVFEWELLLGLSGSLWRENRPTLIDGMYSGAMILAFLSFGDMKVPYSNVLQTLGGKSYGIYLVHGLGMEFFARGVYHVAPWILGRQLLFQPLVILVGLAVPLLLMALVSRSPTRRLYVYIFG